MRAQRHVCAAANTNGFKQRKQKEEVAPYGTVRGIKNLSNNPSPTCQKIQKKTGGLGLEGTFIEFNDNYNQRYL